MFTGTRLIYKYKRKCLSAKNTQTTNIHTGVANYVILAISEPLIFLKSRHFVLIRVNKYPPPTPPPHPPKKKRKKRVYRSYSILCSICVCWFLHNLYCLVLQRHYSYMYTMSRKQFGTDIVHLLAENMDNLYSMIAGFLHKCLRTLSRETPP